MAKTKGNKAVINTGSEKIVTKYDKKVQKRKEEEKRAAKEKKIAIAVCSAIAAVIVICIAIVSWNTYNKVNKEYITVDNDKINQKEFDFYYSLTKNNILSQELMSGVTYGDYFKSYMGYDASASDSSQKYGSTSNDYTWYDYFASSTVSTIKEYKAVLKLADENNFNYDKLEEDYKSFSEDVSEAAQENDMSVKQYYKAVFGKYATADSIKPYVDEYLKAVAYQDSLAETLKASDSDVKEYYEKNKDDYDMVDYRALEIAAENKEDEASLKEAKEKAEEFKALIKSEDDFKKHYEDYAAEDDEEKKEEEKNEDPSLLSKVYKSQLTEDIAEWLFDSERKEGDIVIVEDTENGKYIVMYFIKRDYDDDNDENIANVILSNRYSEKVEPYVKEMQFEDKSGRIKMLGN